MNDQKQQNGNRPQGNQQNNNQQNNNQQNNNQQRKDLPKVEPIKNMQNSQPKTFNSAEVEPAGQKYVSIAIIAFLLGFGAAALWFGDATTGRGGTNATSTAATSTKTSIIDEDSDADEVSSGTETTPNIVVNTTPNITVGTSNSDDISVDNQSAGTSVVVREVTVTEPSWLAVSEPVQGGVRILGAKLVDVGTTNNVKIDLLRGTLAGKTYTVVVRADNGDHVFVSATDKPVVGSNGQEFADSFTVTQ